MRVARAIITHPHRAVVAVVAARHLLAVLALPESVALAGSLAAALAATLTQRVQPQPTSCGVQAVAAGVVVLTPH
jgi:hypothetical protein